jgi:hypothetical protein
MRQNSPAPSRGAQEKSTVRLLYLDFLAFCSFIPHRQFRISTPQLFAREHRAVAQGVELAQAICGWTRLLETALLKFDDFPESVVHRLKVGERVR